MQFKGAMLMILEEQHGLSLFIPLSVEVAPGWQLNGVRLHLPKGMLIISSHSVFDVWDN